MPYPQPQHTLYTHTPPCHIPDATPNPSTQPTCTPYLSICSRIWHSSKACREQQRGTGGWQVGKLLHTAFE